MLVFKIDFVEQIEVQYDNKYIPQIKSTHKPHVSKEFDSLDEIHSFYNMYTKEGEFTIQSNSTKKHKKIKKII